MQKRSKNNVLIVSEYFYPAWSGLSQSIFYMAQDLQSQGYNLEVLTTHFDTQTLSREIYKGIPITRVPYQFMISRTHYSFSIILKYTQLLSRFDTIIVNSPNSNILFYSVLAKLFGKKLIIYHQADILLPRQTGNIIKHWFIERMFDLFTIPSVLLADHISSFTKDYAEFSRVLRYGLHKFTSYIPAVQLSSQPPQTAMKRKLERLKRFKLIGISGRFVEEKGYDILFNALPIILREIPNAHIVFAGKKVISYEPFFERHKQLFRRFDKNVTYLGLLSDGDYATFFESLDVFVLSSRIECFALTQIEATIKGVPIVVTDVAGARQLVKNSGFGKIVHSENPNSLAEGIIEVLQKPRKFRAHQKAAREYLKTYQHFIISE